MDDGEEIFVTAELGPVSAQSTLDLMFENGEDFIKSDVSLSYYANALEYLSFQNVDNKNIQKNVQKLKQDIYDYIQDISKKQNFKEFPNDMNQKVYTDVLKNRCSLEREYLKGIPKDEMRDVLQEIIKMVGVGDDSFIQDNDLQVETGVDSNPLNLPNEDLCQAIQDLNDLARLRASKKIGECGVELGKLEELGDLTGLVNETRLYNMKIDIEELNRIVEEFDTASNYFGDTKFCGNGDKCSPLQKLHRYAVEAVEKSKVCKREISDIRRTIKVERVKRKKLRGEKVGFIENVKARFF